MKNLLIKTFLFLLKQLIPTLGNLDKILIVTTTGLGDTLWATPAIQALKKSFPRSHLAVLTSPIGLQVLQNNPHIDDFFSYKEPLSFHFFSLWKKLVRERFGTVLVFHASERLVLPLCSLLGAKRIVGTLGLNKGLDALFTHGLAQTPEHEIVRRLNIVRSIGASVETEKLSFFLKPEESHRFPKPGPWIALHPGSKDTFKRWPYFIELGKLLKQMIPCEILVTGTKEELALMQEVAGKIPGAHIDRHERSLREFAAMLNQVDLLIANDTGPLHLACALNKPVIGIYCSTDPSLCGPHAADKALSIVRPPSCTPCLKRKCRQPFCFLQIGPEEVAQGAKRLLFLLEQLRGNDDSTDSEQTVSLQA